MSHFRLPSRARRAHYATMAAYTAIMLAAFGAGVFWPTPRSNAFLIEVETRSGDIYIAGSGSSCASASQHAKMPDDWTRIICRKAR